MLKCHKRSFVVVVDLGVESKAKKVPNGTKFFLNFREQKMLQKEQKYLAT